MDTRGTIFREIHKNTWLKRLTVDNKKITVGPKKSDRTWVVFCVHDDTEAILEGYIEPRQAAFHTPEWTVPLQTTLHISHALVPNESEYEFVITLASDVIRFNAASWDTMKEWVDTLRQKLREMKIISPRDNLYSKLPEVRPPLLPTRDPTSPLPAPPPVPAALVPGIEQIIPASTVTNQSETISIRSNQLNPSTTVATTLSSTSSTTIATTQQPSIVSSITTTNHEAANTSTSSSSTSTATTSTSSSSLPATAMSNTLTQNLINMLTSPMSTYSSQVTNIIDTASESSGASNNDDDDDKSFFPYADDVDVDNDDNDKNNADNDTNDQSINNSTINGLSKRKKSESVISSLAKTFSNNVLSDPNTCPSTSGLLNKLPKEKLNTEPETDTETNRPDSTPAILQTEPLIIPRPQTTRNSSRNKRPTPPAINNNKSFPVAATINSTSNEDHSNNSSSTNITIIQVSSPITLAKQSHKEIFHFPITKSGGGGGNTNSTSHVELADDSFKSNVQIIPSNYSPSPPPPSLQSQPPINDKTSLNDTDPKVTTVQVPGSPSHGTASYGKLANIVNRAEQRIKNFGPITNIPIGTQETTSNTTQLHYEQVFVTSSSIPSTTTTTTNESQSHLTIVSPKLSLPNSKCVKNTSQSELLHVNRINLSNKKREKENNTSGISSILMTAAAATTTTTSGIAVTSSSSSSSSSGSSIVGAVAVSTPSNVSASNISRKKNVISASVKRDNLPSPLPAIRQFLQRGLTEAAIIRPSRKDSGIAISQPVTAKQTPTKTKHKIDSQSNIVQQESSEQRRRSSSTSDAQGVRNRSAATAAAAAVAAVTTTTNSTVNNTTTTVNATDCNRRMQPAPQPFRPAATIDLNATPSTRLTLREQQVFQLRREMMHPGGVRLQLRRKDCTGSIALVDAFGAVWISGWKQKEHPMLYNALHIGDQLVSCGGINISTAAEANRIIRNTPGLYIEFIIRRIPFGRVYAIRRELDGQCIGLIRDGNTATIVDVVPNSLSARHGLPPKAQSCDGLSLTFWVLTEINGRPLNLYFKENEVRDRLNAVGRDLSILVQPSDLITKLKKQLKSLRSYKDYIVQ